MLCVVSRAREAEAERGEFWPRRRSGGGGDFLFWLIGGGEAAAAPAVSSTMSYRVGSSDRPIDRLVV